VLWKVAELYGANENLARSLQRLFRVSVDRQSIFNVNGVEFRRTEIALIFQ
jgi:hypothetical protein